MEFKESVALPPGPLDLAILMQDMVQHRKDMKEIIKWRANMIPVGFTLSTVSHHFRLKLDVNFFKL